MFRQKLVLLVTASAVLAACNFSTAPTATPAPGNTQTVDDQPSHHERLLPISSTRNFRDMGGYSAKDGRTVKWNTVYRSESLSDLDAKGWEQLRSLDLAVVTDLRSKKERSDHPYTLPGHTPPISYVVPDINKADIDISNMAKKMFANAITEEDLEAVVGQKRFMDHPEILQEWGVWLRGFAQPSNQPQLFHCTSGKDRTGFAAAILLLTLGVPKETVMEDFLLSNIYLNDLIVGTMAQIQEKSPTPLDKDMLHALMGVRSVTLETSFERMREEYGSIDEFIEKGLGIDDATREKIKANLLE